MIAIKYKIYIFIKYTGPALALIILLYAWWFVRQVKSGMPDIEDVEMD